MEDLTYREYIDALQAKCNEIYTKEYLEKLYYTDNPFFALVKKDHSFIENTKEVKYEIEQPMGLCGCHFGKP